MAPAVWWPRVWKAEASVAVSSQVVVVALARAICFPDSASALRSCREGSAAVGSLGPLGPRLRARQRKRAGRVALQ